MAAADIIVATSIDDLRDELDRVIELRERAIAKLTGEPTPATQRASKIAQGADRRIDELKREIKRHPDYELWGL